MTYRESPDLTNKYFVIERPISQWTLIEYQSRVVEVGRPCHIHLIPYSVDRRLPVCR